MKISLLSFSLSALVLLCGCSRNGGTSTASASAVKGGTAPGRIVLPLNSPKLGLIRVEPVRSELFPVEEVVAPGKVEANPNRIARVLAPVPGRVRRVLVKLGDSVAEGQPLVTFDSPEAGAAVSAYRQAQAQERQTKATLAKAQKDLARVRDLSEHRAAALKDVLAAENDLSQAQAAVDQAQASAEESLQRLDLLGLKAGAGSQEVVVRSPLPGKVLEIAVVPGEYRNDSTSNLMTVADLRTVWIAADVSETDIRLVRIGEGIQVNLSAYPDETFRGRVMRIADMVDPDTRTVKVQAEILNPSGKLRPEMFGKIRHNHGLEAAAALPSGAVVQREGKNIVLLEERAGTFREVEVTVGARKGDMVAILSGVKSGDRVVVDGPMLLGKD